MSSTTSKDFCDYIMAFILVIHRIFISIFRMSNYSYLLSKITPADKFIITNLSIRC